MLALTLRARRDNLLTSIALLERRVERTPGLSQAA
jgi:hypothetical protein